MQSTVELIQDGSFELGSPNPYWTEFSTIPLYAPIAMSSQVVCDPASGDYCVEFPWGIGAEHWVAQTVTIPASTPVQLSYMSRHDCDECRSGHTASGGRVPPDAILQVEVDGAVVYAESAQYPTYEPRSVSLDAYADGLPHELKLRFLGTYETCCSFCVDDVSLTVPAIPQTERDALIAFYNATSGAGWTDSSGWLGPPGTECSWFGVTCNAESNYLIELTLDSNNLVGIVPPELADLTELNTLWLTDNALSGPLPSELGSIPALTRLVIAANDLTGGIPASLGSLPAIDYLDLNWNHLTGPIPAALGAATTLTDLRLIGNQLDGPIPAEIGNLGNLVKLYVDGNSLSGEIPTTLTGLTSLPDHELRICENQLYTDDPVLAAFLDQKAEVDWATCQVPTVRFDWSPPFPSVDQPVQLADATTAAPTSWSWTFGDGGISTEQHPVHVWAPGGTYTITLSATNAEGTGFGSAQIAIADVTPTAAFEWTPTAPTVGEIVQLTDTSSGYPTGWSWDFGDGAVSTVQHPTHAWASGGDFTVSLAASNGAGSNGTSHTVHVTASPSAAFTWSPGHPEPGEAVQFTDQSVGEPASWSWAFGDGATSNEASPSHQYAVRGLLEVSLTVANAAGSDVVSHTVTVGSPPEAEFSWAPTAPGVGESVRFTDRSTNQPDSWLWDFGDGTTSPYRYDDHAFEAAGEYEVSLTVANAVGSGSVAHIVVVGGELVADFSWTPETPALGEEVQFTDLTGNGPMAWSWDFGDGGTSTAQHPRHSYTEAGSYQVQLTASNAIASASTTRTLQVIAEPASVDFSWSPSSPGIGELVRFELTGVTNDVTAVRWHFGAPGCPGSPREVACTTTAAGCLECVHRFAAGGAAPVSVVATSNVVVAGSAAHTLIVEDNGSCDEGPVCGNGRCDAGESALSCPADCAAVCGNLVCEVGEDPCNCASDCQPVCGNGICEAGEGWVECVADCERPADFAGGGVETCTHCLLPAAVGTEPGLGGTLWRGEAMLSNLDPEAPLVFWSVFTPDSPAAKADPLVSEPAVLEPGESLYFSSFVEEVFGVSGSGNVQLMADVPLTVTTRIYNTGEDGTYGQLVDAFDASSIVCPGQLAILIGLEQDADYRTNVFVQDVSGVGATFDVEVFGPRSQPLGALTRTVASSQTLRIPLSQVPGASGMRGGYGTVRVTTGGRVAVIASVVDNATGDAVTVKPMVIGRMGAAKEGEPVHALVPVAARADGFEGTVWRTQLVVLNLGDTQDVRLELHPTGWATPVERTYTLGPRGMIASRDIVEQLLGDVQAQGALHVYSETPVGIDSRTRNLGSAGTYGDSLKGLRSGDLLQTGETGSLELLESSPTFRTNIGFANLAGADATVELTLFRLVGTLPVAVGSRTYTVPAMRTLQVNKVFDALGAGTAQPAKATVRVLAGGPIYAYASKVDNATGDPTNIVAVPVR